MDKKGPYIASAILLIIVLIFAILYFNLATSERIYPSQEVVKEKCPLENKALMFGILNSWGENLYDSSEYLLTVDVYNFGEFEAKNVEVICEIYVGDENGYTVSENPIRVDTKRIGNVASKSYKYAELKSEKNLQEEGEYPLAVCSINYCENCEILDERIEGR